MSRAVPKDQKKCETNSEPRLDVMWDGTPCFEKTWRMKSCARSWDVMVSCIGINSDCLDKQSMMTSMDVQPEDDGSCSMKSIKMEFQGCSGTGSCFRRPWACAAVASHGNRWCMTCNSS